MYEVLIARIRYHIQKADFMGLKEHEGTLLLNEAADAIEELLAYCNNQEDTIKELVDELEGKDKVLKQVYWERDTALHQLAEIGKGLGEKMDSIGCPHYIRNVHDRGDDSLCEKYHCEVKAVERRKGKWTLFENDIEQNAYECSACKDVFVLLEGTPQDNLYNFCPNCGADMRGDGDDNKQA